MKFKEKSVIVTGAASGIGAAAALRMVDEGALVLALDIDESGLAKLQAEVKAKGKTIEVCLCNVSKEEDVKAAVSRALSAFGRIDVLVHAAGISYTRYATETTWEEYSRMMDVNMGGTFLLTRHILPHMEQQKSGAIVYVASELTFVGYENLAGYTASKGAIVSFSRSVALGAIRNGVRVNCICPGATDTPIFWDGVTDPAERQLMLDQVKIEKPIGRLVKTEEVANGIVFLASEDASAVVGACLVMDGGFTAM